MRDRGADRGADLRQAGAGGLRGAGGVCSSLEKSGVVGKTSARGSESSVFFPCVGGEGHGGRWCRLVSRLRVRHQRSCHPRVCTLGGGVTDVFRYVAGSTAWALGAHSMTETLPTAAAWPRLGAGGGEGLPGLGKVTTCQEARPASSEPSAPLAVTAQRARRLPAEGASPAAAELSFRKRVPVAIGKRFGI